MSTYVDSTARVLNSLQVQYNATNLLKLYNTKLDIHKVPTKETIFIESIHVLYISNAASQLYIQNIKSIR